MMKSLLYVKGGASAPLDVLWLRFKTDIDVVWWGAMAGRLKGVKERHDEKIQGQYSEEDVPLLKGQSHSEKHRITLGAWKR